MARKKPPRDTSEWVKQSTFRLEADTLMHLDLVAEDLSLTTSVPHTRTDAIRALARQAADKILKRK